MFFTQSIYSLNKKTENPIKYNIAEGFCTDGTYFYVAVINVNVKDRRVKTQDTKIIKIDIKTKKIVSEIELGKIGHSNSMCFNKKEESFYFATCSPTMPYVVKFDKNFTKKEIIYLKDNTGKKFGNFKMISSIAYNPDCYI